MLHGYSASTAETAAMKVDGFLLPRGFLVNFSLLF